MIQLPQRDATDSDRALQRQAQLRAAAIAIVDEEVAPLRRFQVEDGVELRGTVRHRRGGGGLPPAPRAPESPHRVGSALVLAAELLLLIVLLAAPGFRVTSVSVVGARLLAPSQLLAAAGVEGESIFAVDAAAVASRLGTIPWVRSASVSVSLPSHVRVAVVERTPIVRLVRDGAEYAVSASGASLRLDASQAAALDSVPLLVDLRPPDIRTAVSPQLVALLGQAAVRFPSVLGVRVVACEWDATGQLSLWTAAGWEAILGDITGPDQLSEVPAQLAALSALRANLDFANPAHPATGPSFGYVNLIDPSAPAVGGTPGLPAAVTAALRGIPAAPAAPGGGPSARSSASPSRAALPRATASPHTAAPAASPALAPTATPTPAPTPVQLRIPGG